MNEPIRHVAPFGLRMPDTVKTWIKTQADKYERSQNYVIVKIIRDAMERDTAVSTRATTGQSA